MHLSTYSRTIGLRERTLNATLAVFDSLYTQQKSDILKLTLLKEEKDVFSKSYSTIINSIQIKWGKKLASGELERANNNQKRIDSLFALSTKIENSTIGKSIVQLPFKAELYHLDEIKNVDDFLRNLKLKFPNKALILDFWATWCAPCLADLPSSKKLHEANKDLSVEYIYLCTSSRSSLDIWKNKVADLEISGTHIFVDDKIITQLKSTLNAKGGFPSYVVIDINGKINPKIISRMEYLNRESLKTAVGL